MSTLFTSPPSLVSASLVVFKYFQVLQSEEQLRELAYAIHLVSEYNNIKALFKTKGWDVSVLTGFRPRLGKSISVHYHML